MHRDHGLLRLSIKRTLAKIVEISSLSYWKDWLPEQDSNLRPFD